MHDNLLSDHFSNLHTIPQTKFNYDSYHPRPALAIHFHSSPIYLKCDSGVFSPNQNKLKYKLIII